MHAVPDTDIPKKVTQYLRRSSNQLPSPEVGKRICERDHHNGRVAADGEGLTNFVLANSYGTAMVWSKEANKLVCSHGDGLLDASSSFTITVTDLSFDTPYSISPWPRAYRDREQVA